jgi:hypothetical protein
MLVSVIVRTAYGTDERTDYPNLVGKANKSVRYSELSILRPPPERVRFPVSFLTLIRSEDKSMKNLRLAATGTLVAVLLTVALAQKAAPHLLGGDELKSVVPAEFFFRGQKAPTQLRNATGFQTADGKVTFGALIDASGYSTAIQQKYQGMLVTESKLNLGGSELAPGEYGFGFTADKFVVMNVADQDILSAPYQTDAELKRAMPLKMVEDGAGYKLYAGKKWVAVKLQ